MPQVPDYKPIPSVSPTERGTPSVRVDAPAAAFGAETAAGLGHLGNALEKSGDELFQRAYALQQLNNETEARNADAEYVMQSGKMYNDFASLEGKAAQDAYPKLQQDLEGLRTKLRAGLSNPMSAKLYDSSALQTMARTVFAGGRHAATETKKWIDGSNEAAIKLSQVEAGNNWNDPALFNRNLEKIRTSADQIGLSKGWSKVQVEAYKEDHVAQAWFQKLSVQALTDPFKARSEYEKHHDELGAYRTRLESVLEQREGTIGAKIVTNTIANGDYYQRLGTKESGGKLFAKSATSSAEGLYQFTKDTWIALREAHPELNLPTKVSEADAKAQTAAVKAFTEDNRAKLEAGGVPTSMSNLYLAHFLGAGGAVKFYNGMKDDPGKPATLLVSPAVVAANRDTFLNPDGSPRSAASAYIRLTGSFSGPGPLSADVGSSWLSEAEGAAQELVHEIAPNNPMIEGLTLDSVRNRYNVIKQGARIAQQQDMTTVQSFINGGGDPEKEINDQNQLFDNPQMSQLYADLPPPKQNQILAMIRANANKSPPETQERRERFQRLMDMSVQRAGKVDQFLDLDPEKYDLTRQQRNQLYNRKRALTEKTYKDSQYLNHAMGLAKSKFAAYNIKAGSVEYDAIQGHMQEWLEEKAGEKKGRPLDKEIIEKINNLFQSEGKWFFGLAGGHYGYQEPTKDFSAEFMPLYKVRSGGKEPDAEELRKAYDYALTHPDWRTELKSNK